MAKRAARARRCRHPSKSAAETRRIWSGSATQHPDADTELHFTNAFELLVATILSAQSTDERVNLVTPALFKRYPDARALAQGDDRRARAADSVDRVLPREVEIAPRHGAGARRAPRRRGAGDDGGARRAAGRRPQDRERRPRPRARRARACRSIVTCCASRTASASRESDDPEVVEQQLCAALPPADWTRTSDTLILHGRRICKPKPLCDQCAVRDDCDYYRTRRAAARRQTASTPSADGRTAAGEAPRGEGDDAASASTQLVADALARDPAPLPRRDAEHRDRRRGRAVAGRCSRRWRSSRPTRCSGSTRARR